MGCLWNKRITPDQFILKNNCYILFFKFNIKLLRKQKIVYSKELRFKGRISL